MHHPTLRAARLTIATALTGTTIAALAVTSAAPNAAAATQQVRSDSRINIASVSVRSLALTLSPKPGTAVLSWASPRTRTKFTVLAAPVKRPTATRMLKATTGPLASFTGLDENARYVFTVTPQVGSFTGPTSRLLMTATLKQLRSLSVADQLKAVSAATSSNASTAPAATPSASAAQTASVTQVTATQPAPQQSAPQPTPQIAEAPAAPTAPRTRTVYVCPDGFTEVGGVCTTMQPYTYSTLAYTYTWGVIGWHDVADAYAADMARSTGTYCPWGGTYNNGGLCVGATYHRENDYGNIKDPTPAGYTDTGTEWKKRDATPSGYIDDGTQWVKTASKVATEVPA